MNATTLSVISSAIRVIRYEGGGLAVKFHNGRIYLHPRLPQAVYGGPEQASPKGVCLHPPRLRPLPARLCCPALSSSLSAPPIHTRHETTHS